MGPLSKDIQLISSSSSGAMAPPKIVTLHSVPAVVKSTRDPKSTMTTEIYFPHKTSFLPRDHLHMFISNQPYVCIILFHIFQTLFSNPKASFLKDKQEEFTKKCLIWTTVDSWSTLCQLLIWMRNHDLASRFGCLQHCVDQMSRTVRMGSPASWSTF